MNRKLTRRTALVLSVLGVLFVCFAGWQAARKARPRNWADWWRTPDQQGDRFMREEAYSEAARRYRDPMRIGVALFRDGNFEAAGEAFGRMAMPEAHFNRGNALVMRGKYEEAVEAYDAALAMRPDWSEAQDNRRIAQIRAERLKTTGGEMTGGMLEADEIVFTAGNKDQQGGETETTQGGKELSDQELQALWLQRIQTKPEDFLRSKFAYQLARDGAPRGSPGDQGGRQ
jgi:Ca-activated chloride channel family protein